jgi:transposase-like protein
MTALHTHCFTDDNKAREYLEHLRWPDGVTCPHCGVIGEHYQLEGKAHRPGLWKCKACREQFSVTVGTVLESSKISLSKWLTATYLLCSSNKGISSHQLSRTLGVTYKTAWFMSQRVRLVMTELGGDLMGSGGGVVEVDETYLGRRPEMFKRGGRDHKEKVFALVVRGGKARSVRITGPMFDAIKKGLCFRGHEATIIEATESR